MSFINEQKIKNISSSSNSEDEALMSSNKISKMSSKSIFSDMNLSVLIKQALKHPTVERHTKLSLDFVQNNTAYLSEIMNTCNGRDKLLAIIQYSCG